MAFSGLLHLFNLKASSVVTLLSGQNQGLFIALASIHLDETCYNSIEAWALANGPMFGLSLGKLQTGRSLWGHELRKLITVTDQTIWILHANAQSQMPFI